MDNNDKKSQDENQADSSDDKVSQIPLIQNIIFDEQAPLKAPARPRRLKNPIHDDHGADYDPNTLDLFGEPSSKLLSYANDHTEEEIRTSGDQLVDDLVEEYTVQIADQLRVELTDQLHSILNDLDEPEADK